MNKLKNLIEKQKEQFRKKWGGFYYSDTVGMDWEKPQKQNVTGGIPDNHDGFCIASGDIEEDIKKSTIELLECLVEMQEERMPKDKREASSFTRGYTESLTDFKQEIKSLIEELRV